MPGRDDAIRYRYRRWAVVRVTIAVSAHVTAEALIPLSASADGGVLNRSPISFTAHYATDPR